MVVELISVAINSVKKWDLVTSYCHITLFVRSPLHCKQSLFLEKFYAFENMYDETDSKLEELRM